MTPLRPLLLALLLAARCCAEALHPNDPVFDNGPALSEYARNSTPIPAGNYFCKTTIETGSNPGGKFSGVGRSCEEAPESRYIGQPITNLVWNGKPGGTLLHIQRQGFTVEDLSLQGASWKKDWDAPGTGSLVDIENVAREDAYHRPCGNITFNRVSFLAAAYGCRVLASDHGDNLAFRDCVSASCTTVFQCLENQSVGVLFDHLTIKSDFQCAFDLRAGGRFEVRGCDISGQCSGAILSLGDKDKGTGPDVNSNYYKVRGLWLDNVMRNVCVVKEQTANHPSIVKVSGYMCSEVTSAKPPVVQLNKDSRIDVLIDTVWTPRIIWPTQGKK